MHSLASISKSALETKEFLSVLLVDDDELYLQLLRRLLSRDKKTKYKVSVALTGEEAIELGRDNKFDVLILDYHLPGMSGLDCLQAIRSEQTMSVNIAPAIVCTAEGSESMAGEAIRADADDYLPKQNINANSLARSIDNVVTKHRLRVSVDEQFHELQRINQQLEKKNREISNFYQTVSHEVKTPLAAAREFVSLVRDGVAGEINTQQVELMDFALASCDQLTRHFNDLVDMTRLDLDKLPLIKASCCVDSVIAKSVASCIEAIRLQGGELSIDNECEGTLLVVDEDRIVQVLSNLIGNAIKYSPESPIVKVTVKHSDSGDSLVFIVQDKGCGIGGGEKEYIFEKLYQTNKASVECLGAGLGLGLSIAKEIVLLHDGKIWLESEVGVGSQFYFSLPVSPESN